MRRNCIGLLLGLAAGCVIPAGGAVAAESLHYEFKDKLAVYEVTIRTEIPGAVVTYKGHLAYGVKSADATGHLDLFFKSHFDFTKEGEASGVPAGFEGNVVVEKPGEPLGEVTMNQFGGEGRTQGMGDSQTLPQLLGPEWQVPMPVLSAKGASAWTTNTTLNVQTREGGTLVPRKMSVPNNYEITAAAGGKVTLKGHQNWTSPEQAQGKPLVEESGESVTIFDTAAGVVESLHETTKHTMVRGDGELATFAATIDAHLLKGPEADGFGADVKEAVAKYQEHVKRLKERDAFESADAVSALPPGMAQTQMIGLDGGGSYIRIDHAHRPMLGMAIRLGQWGGHTTLGHVQPIYAVPANPHLEETEICLAKEGYVVGGIVVSKKSSADGLQLIFVKSTPKGVDAQDSYRSPWFGDDGGEQTQIAGNGERVVGTFGQQGMNNNKIGLVLDVRNDPKAAETARMARSREAARQDGLEEGTLETEQVGGDGGGPYVRIDAEHRPLIGFRIKLGGWGGHATLGQVEPLFEVPTEKPAEKDVVLCVARAGYAVGGVTVHKDTSADGLRVIFIKSDGDRLDPKQTYTGPWIGYAGKGKNTQLLGTGEKVIGIVGREGLNNDSLGLVYEVKRSGDAGAPAK